MTNQTFDFSEALRRMKEGKNMTNKINRSYPFSQDFWEHIIKLPKKFDNTILNFDMYWKDIIPNKI